MSDDSSDVAPDTGMTDIALPDITGISEAEGDLTRAEAEYLTEMIRATADMMWVLLSRAHQGKAWKVLGYSSFGEYVNEEFHISRSRAYQLLAQARIVEALEAAAPDGTDVHITEAAARDLKNFVDDLVPEVAKRTEGMTPDDAADEIAAIVEEARSTLNSGDPVDIPVPPAPTPPTGPGLSGDYGDDFADNFVPPEDRDEAPWREPTSGPVPGPRPTDVPMGDLWPGGNQDGPDDVDRGDRVTPVSVTGGEADDEDEDWEDWDDDEPSAVTPTPAKPTFDPAVFDEYDEDDEEEVNPALLRRRVQSAYDLYSTLMTMTDMPAPGDVIAIIPVERRLLVDQSIDAVIDWLTQFRDEWKAQPFQNPGE